MSFFLHQTFSHLRPRLGLVPCPCPSIDSLPEPPSFSLESQSGESDLSVTVSSIQSPSSCHGRILREEGTSSVSYVFVTDYSTTLGVGPLTTDTVFLFPDLQEEMNLPSHLLYIPHSNCFHLIFNWVLDPLSPFPVLHPCTTLWL